MAGTKLLRWPKVALGLGGVLVLLFVGSLLQRRLFWGPKACQIIKSSDIAQATGRQIGPSTSFTPDRNDARTTGCSLGETVSGTYAIVFAVDRGAEAVFERSRVGLVAQGATLREQVSADYRAYATTGPLGTSESLALLRKGTYVNVLLFNAPAGSVDKLAPVVASRIG